MFLDNFIISTQRACGSETEAAKMGIALAPENDPVRLRLGLTGLPVPHLQDTFEEHEYYKIAYSHQHTCIDMCLIESYQ